MDQRDLSIMIGQAINLAHAEMAQHNNKPDLKEVQKRAKEILAMIVELKQELRGNT